MYQTDFICTYKLLNKQDNTGEDNTDIDIDDESDKLYQAQFLQVFDCIDGYDDTKISNGLAEVRNILENHTEGAKFLEAAFCQGLPPMLAIFASLGSKDDDKDALMDTIIRSYYGWNVMDIMHNFVCKVKNGDDVKQDDWENIITMYRELYGF